MESEQALHSPYERIRHNHISPFAQHLEGSEDALFCTVSSSPLLAAGKNALLATAKQLGYHEKQLAFIVLSIDEQTLSPQDLFTIIETLDPRCVVCTDHEAVRVASAGYNTPLALETREYLLGRNCSCFEAFEDMLTNNELKQKAWACLKTLPAVAH